jgi:hypothetical protein
MRSEWRPRFFAVASSGTDFSRKKRAPFAKCSMTTVGNTQ